MHAYSFSSFYLQNKKTGKLISEILELSLNQEIKLKVIEIATYFNIDAIKCTSSLNFQILLNSKQFL